jgi:glycosyltransferase involved in cell wall biosynthesis
MKVSIITVCYKSIKTIEFALRSALTQSYADLELVVVDGNSNDGTTELVAQLQAEFQDRKIIYKSEPDNGIYDAMNKGLVMATGDLIGFLNADDFLIYPDAIAELAKKLGSADAIYADLVYVDSVNAKKIIRYWKSGSIINFKLGWIPPHPTFYCRKTVFDKLGGFDASFKTAGDYELMLRFIYKNQISIHYLPKILVGMRVGGVSNATLKGRTIAYNEEQFAWKNNGLKLPVYTLLFKKLRKIPQFLLRVRS